MTKKFSYQPTILGQKQGVSGTHWVRFTDARETAEVVDKHPHGMAYSRERETWVSRELGLVVLTSKEALGGHDFSHVSVSRPGGMTNDGKETFQLITLADLRIVAMDFMQGVHCYVELHPQEVIENYPLNPHVAHLWRRIDGTEFVPHNANKPTHKS